MLFPEPRPVEGKREFVATLIKLPAQEALPLLWGDAEKLKAGIDALLAKSIAEPLELIRTHTPVGDEIDVSVGGKTPFTQLWANDRRFGQPPEVEADASIERLIGTRCLTKDGRLEFEYDLRAPQRWVWKNGKFWGGSEFAFLQRSVFTVETQQLPIGIPGLVGAAEFAPSTETDGPLQTCLLFTRHSAAPEENLPEPDVADLLRFDLVTFSTSDWTAITRVLLRTGSDGDEDLFQILRNRLESGKSEIRALHSIVARPGQKAVIKSQLEHQHPLGFEPSGGRDRQARRYVPSSFRAIPETIGEEEFGTQIEIEFRMDGKRKCDAWIAFESTLEPPFEALMKINPALTTEQDPAAVGAVQGYQLNFGNSYELKLGKTRLILAHKPQQFLSAPRRSGEWQMTFVRASKPL